MCGSAKGFFLSAMKQAVGNEAIGSGFADLLPFLHRSRHELGSAPQQCLSLHGGDMVLFEGSHQVRFVLLLTILGA